MTLTEESPSGEIRRRRLEDDQATQLVGGFRVRTPPVFVDPSPRRRWGLRLIFLAVVGVGLFYTGLVVLSLLGGPVQPGPAIPAPQSSDVGGSTSVSAPAVQSAIP